MWFCRQRAKPGRAEDFRAYLAMVQAVVSRHSVHSASIKGWAATAVFATLAFLQRGPMFSGQPVLHVFILALPMMVVLFFWLMDTYYLWRERGYRNFYGYLLRHEAAYRAGGTTPMPFFSLDLRAPNTDKEDFLGNYFICFVISPHNLIFYIGLSLLSIIFFIVSLV